MNTTACHAQMKPTATNSIYPIPLFLASTLPFLGAYIYFFLLSGTKVAMVAYTAVKLFTLFFPITAALWIEHKRPRLSLPDSLNLSNLLQGLITGFGISLSIASLFVWTPLGDIILAGREQIVARVAGLGVLSYYVPFAIFLSLAHSLLEEYYWRWYVFGRMNKGYPGIGSHLLAGLAFSLHHYVILAAFFGIPFALLFGTLVGVGGIIWSWQYQKSGNLLGSWISHMVVDAAILTVGYFIIFG